MTSRYVRDILLYDCGGFFSPLGRFLPNLNTDTVARDAPRGGGVPERCWHQREDASVNDEEQLAMQELFFGVYLRRLCACMLCYLRTYAAVNCHNLINIKLC